MRIKNADVRSFYYNLVDRQIVAFCAGLQLHSFVNMYEEELRVSEKIKYIVDNNKNLWERDYIIRQKKYKIYSPEVLADEKSNLIAIVIFNQNGFDIINQLSEMDNLQDAECYIFPLMQTHTLIDYEKIGICADKPKIIAKKNPLLLVWRNAPHKRGGRIY